MTEQLTAFTALFAVGYPLHSLRCVNSPLTTQECGGFEYRAPVTGFGLSRSFINAQTDWDTGQSGGPILGNTDGTAQVSALGIVVRSNEQDPTNFALRFTPEIVRQVCQDIFTYPSSTHSHECEQSPTALQ